MTESTHAHGAPVAAQPEEAARLEELIHEMDESAAPNPAMREHLDAAHFYLLGGMRREYDLTLKLAEEILPGIRDERLERRIADFLRSQQTKP
jgi:hypothetical protein